WSSGARRTPRLRVVEAAPVAFLVLLCLALTAASGPVMRFLESTARSLHDPGTYIRTVLSARDGAARAPDAIETPDRADVEAPERAAAGIGAGIETPRGAELAGDIR